MKKMIKKIGLAVFLASTFGVAQANSLSIVNKSVPPKSFTGYDGQPLGVTGPESTGWFGALSADHAGTFSVTYLGNESGYSNKFKLTQDGGWYLTEADALGTTKSAQVDSGTLPFKFKDSLGVSFYNGSAQTDVLGFMIMQGQTNKYGTFDYLLGFNDSYRGDADYDDYVVGVNFTPSPVPLPAAAWLFGSALLGFVSVSNRRRV